MAAEKTADEKQSKRRRRRRRDSDEDEQPAEPPKGLTEGKGYATPGRRTTGKEKRKGNAFTRPFINLAEYLGDVNSELKKVSWPTREETARLTRIVIIATIIAALVLGAISTAMSIVIRQGLDFPIILVVIMVGATAGVIWYFRQGNRTGGY